MTAIYRSKIRHPKMYKSITSWHHDYIFLDLEVPGFSTKKEAEAFGRSSSQLSLLRIDGQLCLNIAKSGTSIAIPREWVKIQEYQRPRPRPLDISNSDDVKILMDSIGDESSPYHITDDKLADVDWTFEELQQRVPEGCQFSSLSYGSAAA